MLIGRLTLAATALSLGTMSAPAFAQGSLPDQLAVCARIAKKDARLECYDSIARAAARGVYTSGFGASSMQGNPPPPPPPAAPRGSGASSFGAEQIDRPIAQSRAEAGDSEISAPIVSSRDNGLSMWQFTFADGMVWRMSERDSNFRPPAPNEVVTIRKGALGSYLMQVGKQAAVRVTRVR